MENVNYPNKFQSWVLASRPKTLPAAVVPVLVGTALAAYEESFRPLAALVALLCSLLIQIGTNFVNDLYDFLAGTDKKDRPGPLRVLANGLISVGEMKAGIVMVFGLAFLLGMYLVSLGGLTVLAIGVLSILAGMAYTAGPYPLAYNGLGDVFVFLFFGLVGTVGTFYVQALRVSAISVWASVPVGALITNILVVNNYRDRDEDRAAGKRTTAVIFGKKFARLQYIVLLLVSYLTPVVIFSLYKQDIWVFLPLLTTPLALHLIKMIYSLEGSYLNKTLELTAKLSALYGFLFAVGILV
ncbi:MAG: 1,4-dihydroxy-2-naphthoate polyprenyltransferase [Ignavibacteria bacterium]|jgi:1,4-dihydroxy-2-naphthoate octaprenyltransferase|nr:1,4-dihydroxy-2-naphthoate polyprenyltransferase [Ignavibacteria bacterium]MCU7504137.1 1,4-dihydroxy-2-naphthoate polyprenyltransferase [Ignavibacteria bacterium]MCU7516413.1 1,4-dihydroxy-2-naphthoate polyprenyltransferase [Ignavibacteria bacterium]